MGVKLSLAHWSLSVELVTWVTGEDISINGGPQNFPENLLLRN
jgi:hypothetical protein